MPKPKAFLKAEKPKKKRAQNEVPQTADDILAEGVAFEEAGEKWRAGDASKSMRFFLRALDMYSQGLQKFPQNLDLAYNKARVQYEMVTHPVLASQLQVPLSDALNEALKSHQYALQIDESNPDSLFNTAEVLTSIAEELAKNGQGTDDQAVDHLQQALQLFERCLSIQKLRYAESQTQAHASMSAEGEDQQQMDGIADEPDEASKQIPVEERWASIIEPVTEDTILDTVLAEMATLTTLSGLLTPSHAPIITDIETHVSNLLNQTIPAIFANPQSSPPPTPERTFELALAKATLTSAFLDTSFRFGRLDAATYLRELDATFSDPALHISSSATALIAHAGSLITFTTSVADASDDSTTLRHTLPRATSLLTTASALRPLDPADQITTHLLRGDVALLQHRLDPSLSVLLDNAAVFYRNAGKLLLSAASSSLQGASPDEKRRAQEVRAKERVVDVLRRKEGSSLTGTVNREEVEVVKGILTDMVDEGLVAEGEAEMVWGALQG